MIPSKEEIFKSLAKKHGKENQEKLCNSHVTICGLGGLGSNIAIILARAGIGRLTLIDFDKVDISNVNRQQYFLRQIGMNKTDAMEEILKEINPYTEVIKKNIKLSDNNISQIISDDNIICEAFDNADCKAMLVNYVLENYPDKYIISGSGMAGIGTANNIKTSKITSHFYICGDRTSDVLQEGSLVSSRVTVCAAHQANVVINIITGNNPL